MVILPFTDKNVLNKSFYHFIDLGANYRLNRVCRVRIGPNSVLKFCTALIDGSGCLY